MNEKTNANGASGGANTRDCGRAEELVAYFYGESAPEEAADFRRHLAGCDACGEELAAFGGVSEGLSEWREEVMHSIPALNVAERVAPLAFAAKTETHAREVTHAVEATRVRTRTRSASAALREFFTLSPMWLRAGAVAAVLVVCTLAALTLARAEVRWDSNGFAFKTGATERVVEKQVQAPAPNGFTQEQVDALVRRNVEREVAAARERWETENDAHVGVVNASGERRAAPSRNTGDAVASRGQQGARRHTRGGTRGEQLAEDNGDVFYPGEESVPRLTDILGAVKPPVKNEQ
jgi:anti-sigma factor RsiW